MAYRLPYRSEGPALLAIEDCGLEALLAASQATSNMAACNVWVVSAQAYRPINLAGKLTLPVMQN